MRRSTILLSILLLLSASVSVRSQSTEFPLPPQTLIGNVFVSDVYTTGYAEGTGSWQSLINLTWPESPQDDGSFEYNIWITDGNGNLNITTDEGAPIPNRDWRYYVFSTSHPLDVMGPIWTFNVTANNTAAFESSLSCGIVVDLTVNQTITQCGEFADPPQGISVVVANATSPGTLGDITISIAESSSDNDTNWTYPVYGAFDNNYTECAASRPPFGIQCEGINERIFFEFDEDSRDFPKLGNGLRTGDLQPIGLGLDTVYLRATAYDNLTRWVSLQSCEISTDIGKYQASAYCGNITAPLTTITDVVGGVDTPQFPLVNLTSLADALNVTEDLTTTGFAFAIIGTGAVVGLLAGGIVPAIMLAIVGMALAVMLNLLPAWWLVGVFMGGMGIILFRGSKE